MSDLKSQPTKISPQDFISTISDDAKRLSDSNIEVLKELNEKSFDYVAHTYGNSG